MALRDVVNMSAAEREERREMDEAAFRRVHAQVDKGDTRSDAFRRVAAKLGVKREDVIAGYWRHVRRTGAYE